jgi:hypothetical protein
MLSGMQPRAMLSVTQRCHSWGNEANAEFSMAVVEINLGDMTHATDEGSVEATQQMKQRVENVAKRNAARSAGGRGAIKMKRSGSDKTRRPQTVPLYGKAKQRRQNHFDSASQS